MHLLAFALAVVMGLLLGLLGGGGSILTVPIFVYVLGVGAKPAIAMSLPVVGATSLVGAAGHWRDGNVAPRVALLFGVSAMAGAYAGARLSAYVSGAVQLLLLGAVTLAAAASMLRTPARILDPRPHRPHHASMVLVGVGVGGVTGLVGIGGGFLIVPALVLLAGIPMKQAIGTSLVVIAMNSAAGALGHAEHVDLPWGLVAAFTLMAIAGILVGTRLVRYVPPRTLRRGFGVFLLFVGAFILWQNRGAL